MRLLMGYSHLELRKALGGHRLLQGLCTPLVDEATHFPKPLRIHPIQLFSGGAAERRARWKIAGINSASYWPRLLLEASAAPALPGILGPTESSEEF